MILTRAQREALLRIWQRSDEWWGGMRPASYLAFRRMVCTGPDCLMVPIHIPRYQPAKQRIMWLGVERDGYTHT